jgi:hypothetical protein
MKRILVLIFWSFLFSTIHGQVNFKVGYSYFRPSFEALNNAFSTYNSNNPSLVEGFGKTSSISSLDLGIRMKLASYIGIEIGGKYGQSGINRATFASSTEKWSTRHTEFNGGLVFYIDAISFGSSINRSNLAVTRNEPATRKYPSIDQSSYWSNTIFIAFEADSGKSSISIRPFYQRAFNSIGIPRSGERLTSQNFSNEIDLSGFGISLLIFNGRQ